MESSHFICSAEEGLRSCPHRSLYYASVERCASHQEQLEKYSQLLPKHRKLMELENTIKREYDKNKEECEELRQVCARLIAKAAVACAENRAKDSLIEDIKSRKAVETTKLKQKLSKYSQSLQHKYKESLEFSEAERTTLMEANLELESESASLKETNSQLELEIKSLHTQLHEIKASVPLPLTMPEGLADSSCLSCSKLKEYLSTTIEALNDRGCAKYGDLLHSKFTLEQKVKSTQSKLTLRNEDHQRLTAYIQEYKTRSVEKVRILKENIDKADEEISELDKLVDRVREAMHSNMELIRKSPLLLKTLAELDGTS